MPRIQDHKQKLEDLLAELAQANTELEDATMALNAELAKIDERIAPFKETKAEKQSNVDDLREQIKAEGLLVDKADLPKVVKQVEATEIAYDDTEMFQWCVMFNPSLLEIKRSNITQHVNWILGLKTQTRRYFGVDGKKPMIPMPVTVEKVPTIEIATDLSGYLPAKQEAEPEQAEPFDPKAPEPKPAEYTKTEDVTHFTGGVRKKTWTSG